MSHSLIQSCWAWSPIFLLCLHTKAVCFLLSLISVKRSLLFTLLCKGLHWNCSEVIFSSTLIFFLLPPGTSPACLLPYPISAAWWLRATTKLQRTGAELVLAQSYLVWRTIGIGSVLEPQKVHVCNTQSQSSAGSMSLGLGCEPAQLFQASNIIII